MTALRPVEGEFRAVSSDRYPLNAVCAHPECDKPTDDPHHIFPRSAIAGSSWFVALDTWIAYPDAEFGPSGRHELGDPFPHVIGLCRKHHDDVEEHRAWIKLEDGEFVWWDREDAPVNHEDPDEDPYWRLVGPLDPQPARGEKVKKPKKRKTGEARATRDRISIGVPQGEARGGEVWDDLFGDGKNDRPLGRVRERLGRLREEEGGVDMRPPFEVIVDMANDWLNG